MHALQDVQRDAAIFASSLKELVDHERNIPRVTILPITAACLCAQAQLIDNSARMNGAYVAPYMSQPYDPFGTEPQDKKMLGAPGKAFYGLA